MMSTSLHQVRPPARARGEVGMKKMFSMNPGNPRRGTHPLALAARSRAQISAQTWPQQPGHGPNQNAHSSTARVCSLAAWNTHTGTQGGPHTAQTQTPPPPPAINQHTPASRPNPTPPPLLSAPPARPLSSSNSIRHRHRSTSQDGGRACRGQIANSISGRLV